MESDGDMIPPDITEPVRIRYFGTYTQGGHDDELMEVDLRGGRRWIESGWVYRLEGVVTVIWDHDPCPRVYTYDSLLVYMVRGRIVYASETSFWDTRHESVYSWQELEFMITNCSVPCDDAVEPITEEEWQSVFFDYETIDLSESDDDNYSSGFFTDEGGD
jgi:hypothetical protein